MEFNFNAQDLLHTDQDGFAIIDAENPPPFCRMAATTYGGAGNQFRGTQGVFSSNQVSANSPPDQQLQEIIDNMGAASAQAQRLP